MAGGQKQLEELTGSMNARYSPQGVHVPYSSAAYAKARNDFDAVLKERNLPLGTHRGIPDTSELMYLRGDNYVRKDKMIPCLRLARSEIPTFHSSTIVFSEVEDEVEGTAFRGCPSLLSGEAGAKTRLLFWELFGLNLWALSGVSLGRQELAELSAETRDIALSHFRLLEPHLEQDRSLRIVAADAGVPFRTTQQWVAQYRKFGLMALARKTRKDRGEPRAVSPKMRAVIEGLALERPPIPITSICRQIRQFAEVIGESAPATGLCTTIKTVAQFLVIVDDQHGRH